jgi:hypothetical protein
MMPVLKHLPDRVWFDVNPVLTTSIGGLQSGIRSTTRLKEEIASTKRSS